MQETIANSPLSTLALALVAQETRALLTRLERVKPFVLYETMVLAAAPSLTAQSAIERYLAQRRRELRQIALDFLGWLNGAAARGVAPAEAQRRLALLRLRFNDVLSQFDIFADVITQRSERDNGVWLSGLDVVAADALALPGRYYVQPTLQGLQRGGGAESIPWKFWERWISEIVSDLWSVARVGVAGTMGLIGVVSLPTPFVFRVSLDDPHPIPWIRVKLSAAMGAALYPDPQWGALAAAWEALYPQRNLRPRTQWLLAVLERSIPAFVSLLLAHRPKSLRGGSLQEVLASADRQPARLRALYDQWGGSRQKMQSAPPSLVFAVIGQAKADGRISPEWEGRVIADLLTDWAMWSSLDASAICADTRLSRPVLVT